MYMYSVDSDVSSHGNNGYANAPPCCLIHIASLGTNVSCDLSYPLKFVDSSINLYVSLFASHNNTVMNTKTVWHFMQQRPLMGVQKTTN
jgi:hypothetical protein